MSRDKAPSRGATKVGQAKQLERYRLLVDSVQDYAMLRVAQVDAGRLVLRRAVVDMAQLVRDVVAEQTDALERRQQHVELKLPDQLVVEVDGDRLRMVIENLVDNASKYTPEGGTLTVALRSAGNWLQIIVSDTGVGIEADDVDKLFTKFTRIDNTLSESVGGSGLGLYWANKIVELHGGNVGVDSTPGEGTTFTIQVPTGGSNA
jgi:signal transduction histidine kinase